MDASFLETDKPLPRSGIRGDFFSEGHCTIAPPDADEIGVIVSSEAEESATLTWPFRFTLAFPGLSMGRCVAWRPGAEYTGDAAGHWIIGLVVLVGGEEMGTEVSREVEGMDRLMWALFLGWT